MSLVSKKGLEFIINQIGKAKLAYKDRVGDLNLKHGYFLDYEKVAIKFRGSTTFHDYDLSGKTPQGITTKPFQTFDTDDNISFGLQGGKYVIDPKISSFANTGGWTPEYYNPPTTEGWDVLDYNAWQYYLPPYNAAGNANTNYIIYNINSEPLPGDERTNYDYPVRWNGSLYQRVNLFNSSRYISIKNTGTTSNNEAHLIIPKSYFEGAQFINPLNNTPKDLGIASHINLKTQGIGSTFSLSGSMSGLALTYLPYQISEVSSTGTTTTRIKDHYLFKVKLPASWTANYYYHLAFYWDTHDTNFITTYPTYTSGTALTFSPVNLNTTWKIFPRKTYLQKQVSNYLTFDKTGVFDNNVYLFSKNKTNQQYFDGDYIITAEPFRYLYPENLNLSADNNSLSGVTALSAFEFSPVIIATKNVISGNQYEDGDADLYVFFGKALPIEASIENWDNFYNWPVVDRDYDIIAKIILSYPDLKKSQSIVNKTSTSYNINNASIIYIKNVADNFVVPPIGDSELISATLQDILSMTSFTRSTDYNNFFDILSSSLIVQFINYKAQGSKNFNDFRNNASKKSLLLHNLLKYPISKTLKSNYNLKIGSGKISLSLGSNVIIGSLTKFTSEITEGDLIYSSDSKILYGQVLSIITDTYLLLEENYKFSSLSQTYAIKNNPLETEPINILVDEDGSNGMISWAGNTPTTTFFTYDESGINLNKINFDLDTEFEFYQPVSNIPDLLDQETTGNKLSKDYSFSIKFLKSNSDKIIKNININSSKFYISDDEYQNRVSKKLSISGYYKQGTDTEQKNNSTGTFNSMNDYRVYGSAAIIPNLMMGESRTILTKQVEPIDQTKQTKIAFISNLQTSNPSITQTEIDLAVSDYELTKSFYSPSSNQISNKFSSISEVGMTVSNYTLKESPYWISNYEEIVGGTKDKRIITSQNLLDLRSDSFVISIAGYSTSDASINSLENIFNQQKEILDATNINQNVIGSYASVNFNRFSLKFTPNDFQDIKSFKIRLQSLAKFNNLDAYIECSIWDNKDSLPNKKLITGSKVFYSNIKYYFDDLIFYVNYKLVKNRTYWLVFESNTNPPNYDQKTKGLASVSGTAVSGIYNPANNTYTDFNIYNKNAYIGFGSTLYSNISNWYQISSIGSSTVINLSGNGGTSENQNYVIKYDLRIQIQENSSPSNLNIALYDGYNWSTLAGTPYIIFYGLDDEIYSGFNRDFSSSSLVLPGPNKNREADDYYVNEYWSINNQNLFTPSQISIYPRSFLSKLVSIGATGSSGTNLLYVPQDNFNPLIMSGVAVSSSVISSGTSVTSIIFDEDNSQYKVYISNNLSGSANTYYFGDNINKYINRANDIYVYLKYKVGNHQDSAYITLPKSPTWITRWNKKLDWNYADLDTDSMSDSTTATHNLNFSNLSGFGQSYYFNGYSIANFISNSSIGTTFDFQITTNGGVKFFINNEPNAYITSWKNNSLNSFTTSYVATGASQPISFELQFNNYENNHTLKLEWRKTGSLTWYEVNNSFYMDYSAYPILISSDKIHNLDYLVVGKSLSEINDIYNGFPITDKIVIRNK